MLQKAAGAGSLSNLTGAGNWIGGITGVERTGSVQNSQSKQQLSGSGFELEQSGADSEVTGQHEAAWIPSSAMAGWMMQQTAQQITTAGCAAKIEANARSPRTIIHIV